MSPPSVPQRAAGVVPWRARGQDVEVARSPRADAWGLPSAPLNPGETELEGAMRLAADSGLRPRPGRFLGVVRARALVGGTDRLRLTTWWALRHDGPEHAETRWTPAEDLAASPGDADAEVVRRLLAGPPTVGRVVLLRHCEAEQWREGDDLRRPLTRDGSARAARLAQVVAALAVDELVSSPALRCRQTLAPAADLLGVDVVEDVTVGEREPDRDKVAAVLEERGRAGEAVLVCTHAPVVGALLERLAAARPALLPRPARLDAGGAWCVEFDGAGPVGMHYLAPPMPFEESP